VNSPRGNGDYTIDAPVHYPFAFSDDRRLRWLNRQLIKSKPAFHRKTFLKPLHKSAEFCGTCHKVHLPPELNDYKWMRGQNHYDTWLLSGVSGSGVSSFYYPPKSQSCSGCHMPLHESEDFGARPYGDDPALRVHDHLFPGANTAIPLLVGMENAPDVIAAHRKFLDGSMRVDLFALRRGGAIDGELVAPLRPHVPELVPGETVLLDAVIRTMKLGHPFTQGTADSNEVWLEVTVSSGGRVIGKSGGMGPGGEVDPWSHFANMFVLDRDGNRIDRRNPEDIFVPLYNNQIPPGAADVVHYLLEVPRDVREPVVVEVRLQYRKFDARYMKHVYGEQYVNELPVTTLAEDRLTFPVAGNAARPLNHPSPIEAWMRWNDYGIGLLRKGGQGELRQAEEAFREVERLGRADGPLNLARVYLREGRVAHEAPEALRRAAAVDPPAPAWTVLWLGGLVNAENGRFDDAIRDFEQILAGGFEQARGRDFDFTRDYRVLNELALALHERAKQERGEARRSAREALLRRAVGHLERVLELDPEDLSAHYSLSRILTELGDTEAAAEHARLHAYHKPDDNARDRAIALARARYPAANRAAEAVVLYDLRRDGAYGLGTPLEVASLAP
jgi:tetratricopeptide (TPR) repeat protein